MLEPVAFLGTAKDSLTTIVDGIAIEQLLSLDELVSLYNSCKLACCNQCG